MQWRILASTILLLAVAACGPEPVPSAEGAPSGAPLATAEIAHMHAHAESIGSRTTRALEETLERRAAARLTALAERPSAEGASRTTADSDAPSCHVERDGVLSCRVLSPRRAARDETLAQARRPASG